MTWYIFRYNTKNYDPNNQKIVEEQSYSSEWFTDLLDLEAGFLKKIKMFPCFVQEYHTGQSPDWWKGYIPGLAPQETVKKTYETLIAKYVKKDELAFREKEWTGPSAPFDPEILRNWASTWHTKLRGMREEELNSILDNVSSVGDVLSDLEEAAKFAVKAKTRGQQIVFQIRY
jgi:hypothetical protein